MSSECNWIESNFLDPLSDDPSLRQAVDAHLASCPSCREQVKATESVDPLLKAYFSSRMARSRPEPAVGFHRFAAAAVALFAVAFLLGLGIYMVPAADRDMAATVVADEPDRSDPLLGKPSDEAINPTPVADWMTVPPPDPALYVIDAAGYAYTLDDLSGSVVVLGVFSGSGTSRDDVGALYAALPVHDELQFMAISLDEPVPMSAPDLPFMINAGSTLLDTGAGEFAILARDGTVYRRGLLSDDGLVDTVLASLAELDITVTD